MRRVRLQEFEIASKNSNSFEILSQLVGELKEITSISEYIAFGFVKLSIELVYQGVPFGFFRHGIDFQTATLAKGYLD